MKNDENAAKNTLQVAELEAELQREKHKRRYRRALRSTIFILIVIAAVSVLVANLWLPVLQINGTSMTPTLDEGQIVVAAKGTTMECGQMVAFWYGNKMLAKRVIAGPGQWVNIDMDGNVFVDGELLDEPYISEKSKGSCDISLPYQVPDGRYFVMGDHRATSADSRNTAIGCISEEMIVGKIVFRVWPLSEFGKIK